MALLSSAVPRRENFQGLMGVTISLMPIVIESSARVYVVGQWCERSAAVREVRVSSQSAWMRKSSAVDFEFDRCRSREEG